MLKRFLRKQLHKKENGGAVEALLVFSVAIIVFMAIMVITIAAFSTINNKWKIRQTAREYMLLAETQGCLKAEDVVQLKAELATCYLVDIEINSDITELKPFGEQIELHISGKLNYGDLYKISFGNNLLKHIGSEEEINIHRYSTSKQ